MSWRARRTPIQSKCVDRTALKNRRKILESLSFQPTEIRSRKLLESIFHNIMNKMKYLWIIDNYVLVYELLQFNLHRSGAGSHYGTLSGKIEHFSPVKRPGLEYKHENKNFYTNPGKKGTGYGCVCCGNSWLSSDVELNYEKSVRKWDKFKLVNCVVRLCTRYNNVTLGKSLPYKPDEYDRARDSMKVTETHLLHLPKLSHHPCNWIIITYRIAHFKSL